MSVEVKGMSQILSQLEKKFGKEKLNKATSSALKKGSEVVEKEMQEAFNSFKDTGASRNEIVVTLPRTIQGVKQIKLGWNGPKGRWRIIHLNENGYTRDGKRVTPRGYGAIRKAVASSEMKFKQTTMNELKRWL